MLAHTEFPMPEKPFFITTAIDYTNASPHIGHAYEKVLADTIARHRRLCGRETFFLTGVDQHGQKVQQAAQKQGIPASRFAEAVTSNFLSLWSALDISYDRWAATTDPIHQNVVRRILQDLHDRGQLYKAVHSGHYSVRQEQFLTDKERGPDGEFGEEWGEVVFLEEENWYFRLSNHLPWLSKFLDSTPASVLPSFRHTELVNAVGKGGGDLCISRPKSRLVWGIELPFDPDFVTYVWFDALINYISFSGYLSKDPQERNRFGKLWPANVQLIGKDILIPAHGVYWLCMLHAMGFPDDRMPALLVHGWWNLGGAKVSKSLGNVVDPVLLVERYGVAAVRYYLMRDITTGRDSDFSEERLAMIYNTELANGLGNLVNRSVSMAQRYRDGVISPLSNALDSRTTVLLDLLAGELSVYEKAMDGFDIQAGISAAQRAVSAANAYAESTAPWKLAKDPEQSEFLGEVLTTLVLSARLVASLLLPVIPEAAEMVLTQLRLPGLCPITKADLLALPPAHILGEPNPIFPKVEYLPDAL